MTILVVLRRLFTVALALFSFYQAGVELEDKKYPRFFLQLGFGLIFLIIISSWFLKPIFNINNNF